VLSITDWHVQAVILQQQVKAQAEKDVANCEAEWRKLTELIEQDRKQRVRKCRLRVVEHYLPTRTQIACGDARQGFSMVEARLNVLL
jgi:hypothetical protein